MDKEEMAMTERAVATYVKALRLTVVTATKADCEDLAQEIRLKVMHGLERFAGKIPSIQHFIYKSAYFAYMQYRRKYCRVKANETPLDEDNTPVTDGAITIADIASMETAIAIRNAIDAIPRERNREVCRMFFGGKSKTEIARHFGISVTRVSDILKTELSVVYRQYRAGEI